MFTNEGNRLTKKTEEMQKLIEDYRTKFTEMEEKRKAIGITGWLDINL